MTRLNFKVFSIACFIIFSCFKARQTFFLIVYQLSFTSVAYVSSLKHTKYSLFLYPTSGMRYNGGTDGVIKEKKEINILTSFHQRSKLLRIFNCI